MKETIIMANKNSQTNKLAVSLILSQQNEDPPLDCILAEEMTLFNQRKLNRKRTQEIFAHLNSCSDCYMRWLECPPMKQKYTWTFWKHMPKIQWHLPEIQLAPARMVPVLVTALILIAVIFWPHDTPQKDYQYYLENPEFHMSKNDLRISLPWEIRKNHLNFANQKKVSHQKVFATGMWTARQELFPKKELPKCPDFLWMDNNNIPQKLEPYYDLGRWCLFTKVACLKNVDAKAFFKHQPMIAKNLKLAFSDLNDSVIQKQLSLSYDVLLKIDSTSPSERMCYQLMKNVNSIIWHELRN